MEKRWPWLLGIFLFVIAARLFFAFQTPYLTSSEAYLHTRIIENLLNGNLIFNDSLGFGGRTFIHSPLFDLIIAAFTFIMPIELAAKIIPAILASLLVFPAYFLSFSLTKNNVFSTISATLASITPFFFAQTTNHLSTLSISIPLLYALLYLWTQIPKHLNWFLALATFFIFLTPLSLVFIATLAIYFGLCAIDRITLKSANYELGLFTIALTLWAHFLFYKEVLLTHGIYTIWQNIPSGLLGQYYSETNIIAIIFSLGILIVPLGIYAIYKYSIRTPKKEDTLLFSLAIVSFVCLWLKLLPLNTALTLLGITFAILSSHSLMELNDFFNSTKIKKYSTAAITAFAIFLLLTTAIPAYTLSKEEIAKTITDNDYLALSALKHLSSENSKIIAPPEFGHYITGIANRSNAIDTNFLLQKNINDRYDDITKLYTTTSEIEALTIFEKYNATHLFVPSYLPNIKFTSKCFFRTDYLNVHIYQKDKECKVEVVA
jgi:hypothetical protein